MTQIYDTSSLGQLISAECKRQGLTQAELAGLSNIGVTYLSQVERGR